MPDAIAALRIIGIAAKTVENGRRVELRARQVRRDREAYGQGELNQQGEEREIPGPATHAVQLTKSVHVCPAFRRKSDLADLL